MGRIYALLFTALAIAGLSAAQAGSLYKWVDSQGRVSYHDQPPPEGAGYRVEEKNIKTGSLVTGNGTLQSAVEKHPVTLYSVPVCGSCDLVRLYLQKRNVPFTEHNLENNAELQQSLKKKIGALSAPIITIGEKVMKGYVESVLEGELDDVGYPKNPNSETAMKEEDKEEEKGEEKENTSDADEPSYRPTRSVY